MDLSSETNTYYNYIHNTPKVNGTEYDVKLPSELIKNYDVKPGPSHIPRPAKYINKMEPTVEINRNNCIKKEPTVEINRNIVFIREDDEGSTNKTLKKPFKKRLLPSLHKFDFYTNIDSDESSSKVFSFSPTDKDIKIEQPSYTKKDIHSPQYAEKTTYCRPVLNLYNQEFIYKTMERNSRLQKLAKGLIDAREKEKQKEAWNNYINELRNKHRYAEVSHIPNYVQDENADIIDYYNTKYSWQQSNPCHNLLNDFYDTHNEPNLRDYGQRLRPTNYDIPCEANLKDYGQRLKPTNYDISCEANLNDYGQRIRPTKYKPYIFENNNYCYPTSSQGRLLMLNRERQNNRYNMWEYQRPNRSYRENNMMGKHFELRPPGKQSYSTTPIIKKRYSVDKEVGPKIIKSLAVQTDYIYETGDRDEQTVKENHSLVSNNVMRLKQKIIESKSNEKIVTLSKIENKIDILINSVNTFLSEIRSKKHLTAVAKSRAVSCNSFDSNKTTSLNNDHVKFLKDQILCSVVQDNALNSMGFYENNGDTIEDIMFEELNKSDQVKKDIEEILTKSDHSCSVHIEFDIPTKERSTEVTDSSFSKAVYNPQVKFKVFTPKDDRKMTIAVNTDPLGLLALIRVSGDTLKQLLSFMPQIDYYSYLSKLQFSHARTISSFVCNICGAAFNKPSQLSHHIQNHNLGKTRDCCVCRHIMDMKQHRSALFKCQHCGQRFTRAYCKELHEQDCARRLGRVKNRTPSLVMLS